ncbi:hypothetical protein [Vallitalea okinawensis]|uniref:hypothetical protein n=1 Tax=Vallitalea okinawensis TaxID=2078660 RepID=UPI000CFD8875|nr:hypothetical protein [Vallitalea okinawensis]
MRNRDNIAEIRYKNSYVAFLDVLGFKKLVMKDTPASRQKLNTYFQVVNEVIEYIGTIGRKKRIGFIVISDSIILSIPSGRNIQERKDTLRSLCIAVGLIQSRLALKDIWIRGAISSGKAYFNSTQNQIVGPAYINAYLLEEQRAIYPRVIMDSKIINELEFSSAREFIDEINESDYQGLTYDNWGSRILFEWSYPDGKPVTEVSQDVALFIDYLSPFAEKNNNDLGVIIANIQKNIYGDIGVYSKFRWLADYLKSLFIREQKDDNLIESEYSYPVDNL